MEKEKDKETRTTEIISKLTVPFFSFSLLVTIDMAPSLLAVVVEDDDAQQLELIINNNTSPTRRAAAALSLSSL